MGGREKRHVPQDIKTKRAAERHPTSKITARGGLDTLPRSRRPSHGPRDAQDAVLSLGRRARGGVVGFLATRRLARGRVFLAAEAAE